jgi:hypothetical protein
MTAPAKMRFKADHGEAVLQLQRKRFESQADEGGDDMNKSTSSDASPRRDGVRNDRPQEATPALDRFKKAAKEIVTAGRVVSVMKDQAVKTEPIVCRRTRHALTLPVPARQYQASSGSTSVFESNVQSPGGPLQMRERCVVSNMIHAHSKRLHAERTKTLPPRLAALDDQTAIPRDVHSRMLQLGKQASGAMGYGQFRLQFVGPNGTKVLHNTGYT